MNNDKIKKLFGWNHNPFTFNIMPELFVGYEKEADKIMNGLENGYKFSLLLGPTGSGKTTLIKFLVEKFSNERNVIYLSKPPKNPEDWVTIFENITRPRFSLFFSRNNGVNLYNLSDRINKKLRNSRCILFIDECHEASMDSLEWLRTLTDHVDSLLVVMAGLPVFDNILKNNLETFMRRVNIRIELTNLTKSETREMIKKRIEYMGGDDIKPFTQDSLNYIYEKTGGFPREIIRVCNDLAQAAVDRNISIIDSDFLKESVSPDERISLDKITTLPERQRLILETLTQHGELTPTEIIQKLETDDYKDRENAVRSVNNLLRRLMKEKLVERKRYGKAYLYTISERYKTLLVDA